MKRYIRSDIKGKIAETGEPCVMRSNGYWTGGPGGRRTTCYERVDKPIEYDDRGNPVRRLYSMDKRRRFYAETEDELSEYEKMHLTNA